MVSGWVLAWLSVWRAVQTCIWPSWCHCHSLSLASVKSRLILPSWYRLTLVVPDKGPLNGCVCVYCYHMKWTSTGGSVWQQCIWEKGWKMPEFLWMSFLVGPCQNSFTGRFTQKLCTECAKKSQSPLKHYTSCNFWTKTKVKIWQESVFTSYSSHMKIILCI